MVGPQVRIAICFAAFNLARKSGIRWWPLQHLQLHPKKRSTAPATRATPFYPCAEALFAISFAVPGTPFLIYAAPENV